jgi:hypothetical protein
MELSDMSSIDLTLDNINEVTFQVNIEGSTPATPSCRFLIEGEDMSFAFPGEIEKDGMVYVSIPPLEKVLKEGSYNSGLEVIVDDRVFVPLTITTNFEKSVSVTAEAVTRRKKVTRSASAQLIGTSVKNRSRKNQSRTLIGEGTKTATVRAVNEKSISSPSKGRANELDIEGMPEDKIRNLIRSMIDRK